MNNGEFIEIFVDTDLETCEARDPKGLYKKVRSGEIKDFTGISSPYEEPANTEIKINNEKNSQLEDNVLQIIDYLKNNNLINL